VRGRRSRRGSWIHGAGQTSWADEGKSHARDRDEMKVATGDAASQTRRIASSERLPGRDAKAKRQEPKRSWLERALESATAGLVAQREKTLRSAARRRPWERARGAGT
jgi:hypothetical protein